MKTLALGASLLLPTTIALGQIVFHDTWSDGDFTDGADALDTAWYGTTGDSAIEMYDGSLSLRSGTSGRGIHTVFSLQSLANLGDALDVSFNFTTPATVGSGKSAAFRLGLFNSGGADLAHGGFSSSDSVWNTVFGYMQDYDVGTGEENLQFRESLTARSGDKLLGTTTGYDSIGSGGDPYSFASLTSYTGTLRIERTGADELTLTASLASGSTPLSSASTTTTAGVSAFDLLAFHVNSSTFGSTADAGSPDNGIDFQAITVEFSTLTLIPEPSLLPALVALAVAGLGLRRRRRLG